MKSETNLICAEVKCYFCGHVSGQIFGQRHQPFTVSNFRPRPGYQGDPMQPGRRLRCERCQGPVFLEEVAHAEVLARTQVLSQLEALGSDPSHKAA